MNINNRNRFLSEDFTEIYHFGIIDYLQLWDSHKKIERFFKINFKKQNQDLVSCIEPVAYSERFHNFMSEHVFREHFKI